MTTGAAHLEAINLEPGALLALHAAFPESYPALLESAAAAEPLGRFDILFAHPTARLTLTHDGVLTDPRGARTTEPFLAALDRWWKEEGAVSSPRTLPFTGGWLLYLGYELAAQIETRLQLPRPSSGPIAQATRIPAAIVHEHASGRSWIVAEEGAGALVPRIARDVERIRESRLPPAATVRGSVVEEDPRRFLGAVERALEYIRAGDIYQANLSRGWRTAIEGGLCAHDLYRRLRHTNPGPFSGVALLDDMAVISSSPERLVESRDGWVTTRPIAGTRPRGADRTLDDQLARELHAHPKERAEHV
ncbi:MAG: chorismate-binding protein, partial [Steroidobacteraceae bacterium]